MIQDRIREIRQSLGVTQQAFADMLCVKRSTVSQWELGINGLSEPMIKSICYEFGINEEWFRTGCGEMFVRTDSPALDQLFAKLNATQLESAILRAYFRIDPHLREPFIRKFFENASETIAAAAEQKDALWKPVSPGRTVTPPPPSDDERLQAIMNKPDLEKTEEDIDFVADTLRRRMIDAKKAEENQSSPSVSGSVTA